MKSPCVTESCTATILKTAAKGAAAVGAVLGTASGLAYLNTMDLHSVTAAHVGTILAGGAARLVHHRRELQPKVEAPAAYALAQSLALDLPGERPPSVCFRTPW